VSANNVRRHRHGTDWDATPRTDGQRRQAHVVVQPVPAQHFLVVVDWGRGRRRGHPAKPGPLLSYAPCKPAPAGRAAATGSTMHAPRQVIVGACPHSSAPGLVLLLVGVCKVADGA
jgi:hypothetical protein